MADSSILDLVEEINSVREQLAAAKQGADELTAENKRLAPFEGKFEALTADFAELQKVADDRAVGAGESGARADKAEKAQAAAEKKAAKAEKAAAAAEENAAASAELVATFKAQIDDLEGQIRMLTEEVQAARPFVAATQALKSVLENVG